MIQQINNTQSNMSFGMSVKYAKELKKYPQLKKAFDDNQRIIKDFGKKYNMYFDILQKNKGGEPRLICTMTPLSKLGNNLISRKIAECLDKKATIDMKFLNMTEPKLKRSVKVFIKDAVYRIKWQLQFLKSKTDK